MLGYTNELNGAYTNHPVIIFDDFTTASKYVDFDFKAKSSAMKMLTARAGVADLRFVYERMQLIKYPIFDHKRRWIAEFSKLEIEAPELVEQTAIAEVAHDLADHIATLERLIAKKHAIKQGMMQQLLTGRTRLPGFSDNWVDSTLGAIARVTGGGTPSTRVRSFWGGGIPWFTPAEIKAQGSGLVSSSERTITQEGLASSAATLLPAGTVLVTSRASIGNCAVAAVPVSTNQGFTSMIPNDSRSTWFLYYWIQQYRPELESRAAGSTFLEISASKVSAISLRQPSLDEQAAIGIAIRAADAEIDTLNNRLTKARAIKTGMMQQLLTGRTRLPVEAAS